MATKAELQEQNNVLRGIIAMTEAQILDFKQELYGPKFNGVDADGSRKDWMATADIQRRLTEIQRTLTLMAT